MNHTARELILHIGLAKTGTTALQRSLQQAKAELLDKHNVLYPGGDEAHHYLQALFSDKPDALIQIIRLGLNGRKSVDDFLEFYSKKFREEINSHKPRRIIISSEFFSAMEESELAGLRKFLLTFSSDIRIVAYVRDPWSYSISYAQESIRTGLSCGEVELGYAESNVEIFEKFEKVFKRKTLVIPYGSKNSSFDIVANFGQKFGLDALLRFGKATPDVNASMRLEAACAMVYLNILDPAWQEGKFLPHDSARDWMMESLQLSPFAKTPIAMNRETGDKIRLQSAGALSLMKEKYFDGMDHFAETFSLMDITDGDDRLRIDRFSVVELAQYMFSCLRILADRGVHYYVDSLYCRGRLHLVNGEIDLARECFNAVLKASPDHDWASQELQSMNAQSPRFCENESGRDL